MRLDIEVTGSTLHVLLREIWEEEQVSMDWKEEHIIEIPKKGNLSRREK